MNFSGSVQPEVNINIEPGTGVKRDWRIAEARFQIYLLRKIRCVLSPANNFPWIDSVNQICVAEGLRCQSGEIFLAVISFPPAVFNFRTQFTERFHKLIGK